MNYVLKILRNVRSMGRSFCRLFFSKLIQAVHRAIEDDESNCFLTDLDVSRLNKYSLYKMYNI